MTDMTPPRPEQQFFDDPAVDRLVGMVMTLAGELWVLKDRQRVTELLLAEKGTLTVEDLDSYEPTPEEATRLAEERQAFVKSLMDNLLALEQSKSGA